MTDTDFTAYSQLETFLLFQYLAQAGVEAPALARISDKLKSNPAIVHAKGYDAARLSPDSLRALYLTLLKEEAKSEIQHVSDSDASGPNGDGPRNSRKRKARSPSVPTIQDVVKRKDLLPALVLKLYTRYRETLVRQIREEERKYDLLKSDIEQIERGDWDERLKVQNSREAGDLRTKAPKTNGQTHEARADGPPSGINGTLSVPQSSLGSESTRAPNSPRAAAKNDPSQPGVDLSHTSTLR